jgi:hypothetical protein
MPINQGRSQFQGLFSEMWSYSESVDFGNAATGSGTFASVDVTVPGVALGDMVLGFSVGVSEAGLVRRAYVSAANTVTIVTYNPTAGSVDLASTVVDVIVARMV